jgi:hypothetical protein
MKLDEILNILLQTKFENHEIRQELMISYVKLVINQIECFKQVIMDGV